MRRGCGSSDTGPFILSADCMFGLSFIFKAGSVHNSLTTPWRKNLAKRGKCQKMGKNNQWHLKNILQLGFGLHTWTITRWTEQHPSLIKVWWCSSKANVLGGIFIYIWNQEAFTVWLIQASGEIQVVSHIKTSLNIVQQVIFKFQLGIQLQQVHQRHTSSDSYQSVCWE